MRFGEGKMALVRPMLKNPWNLSAIEAERLAI
jgi:hypothetical protein